MDWTLENHDGKLAIALPAGADWNRPVYVTERRVSTIDAAQYARLLGRPAQDWSGNHAVVFADNRTYRLDTSDWTEANTETKIRKPRKRSDYDWRWYHGRWVPDCGDES